MDGASDVVATWAWGLRRYAWIVVLLVVGLGVLVPVVQSRSATVYEAQSQVGPSKPLVLTNLDPLPRFAESVFTNGAVAHDVRQLLRLPSTTNVIPETVTLTAAQANPVMVIHGRGSSPPAAAAVANQAAATFVEQLNKYSYSVGTFAVQSDTVAPAKPAPKLLGGPLALVVGVLAGLVAGIGAVGLILVLRNPVVGAAAAESATSLPVLGRVHLPRKGPPDGNARMDLGALSRRLLTGGYEVVYVAGPAESQTGRVSTSISELLDAARIASHLQTPGGNQKRRTGPPSERSIPRIVVLDVTSLEHWIGTPDDCSLTLVLVPEGIRARALHKLLDRHATGSPTALVLMALHRRGLLSALKTSGRGVMALHRRGLLSALKKSGRGVMPPEAG